MRPWIDFKRWRAHVSRRVLNYFLLQRYYTLEAELDVHYTKSDANLTELYQRIGELETTVHSLEKEKEALEKEKADLLSTIRITTDELGITTSCADTTLYN